MPSSPSPQLAALLAKLGQVRPSGNGWTALCPSHKDKHNSLSITEKGDKILVNCFLDCQTENIMRAVGMELKDLFTGPPKGNGTHPVIEEPPVVVKETVWQIKDADGVVVAEHIRLDHKGGGKRFAWRRNNKPSLDGLKTADLPLYGVDRLMLSASETDVIITEGEKAADAIAKMGKCGLGTVTGASGCPSSDSLAPLIGFTGKVYLWPDNDDPGRKHMGKVAERLHKMGKQPLMVTWAEAPEKGDAADYPEDEDLGLLLWEASPYVPSTPTPLLRKDSRVCMYEGDTTNSGTKGTNAGQQTGNLASKNGTTVSAKPCPVLEPLVDRVTSWVRDSSGWWSTQELDNELGISGTKGKENRKKIIQRLREQGIIERHPTINKQFRYVNVKITSLEFKTAKNEGIVSLYWPMDIQEHVNLFPGNLVVVAGSPNAGKTALLLNLVRLNMDDFPIYYFCSEMGAVELRNRLQEFPGIDIEDWHFHALERVSDFADVIVPDAINIIDYLEMTTELYMINTHLTAISHKIGSGIAVVAVQKKVGATFGRGLEFGLEKPKLYLSMDRGKMSIVKGKSWAKKNVDPTGLAVSFKIMGGCQFEITKEWDWPRGDER